MTAAERADQARNFPKNTCPASRHVQQIGEALARGESYPMLYENQAHCAESMLSVVASLWEARTEIERLRAGIQNFLDGNYPPERGSSKLDKCHHDRYFYEGCEACIDEYFVKLLAESKP